MIGKSCVINLYNAQGTINPSLLGGNGLLTVSLVDFFSPLSSIFHSLGTVTQLIFTLLFVLLFFGFGQKLQMRQYIWDIDRGLRRLDLIRTQAKDLALKTIKEIGKPTMDPLPQLNVLMESFLITPVNMDPSGIVSKFDHLLDVRDVKFKEDVQKMAPSADSAQVNNLENLVEASWALNTIFRIIRHFYLLGKKTNSIFIIIQLQALLPMIMQEAEAYLGAGRAFAEGQPIGDGLGALVASKLMKDKSQRKVEKDVSVAETTLEDRRVIALKAEGPGGNVGKTGDDIQALIQENNGKVTMSEMVCAAWTVERD